MSVWARTEDGDSELAAPAPAPDVDDVHAADASGAPLSAEAHDDEVVRARDSSRPTSLMLMLGALLVLVVAQLAFSWLLLGTSMQVRDQVTLANARERCLLQAQLNPSAAGGSAGAAAAIQSCLK